MAETQTQEAPATAAPAAAQKGFQLAPPRGKLKTGMPTDGIGIFVGLPKSGKTTLGASIPNAVVLELEAAGADRVAGWVQDVPDLVTFRAALKAAVAEPKVKTIVIDSVDVFNDLLEAEVGAQFGLDNVSQRKEGVNGFEVWKELRSRYEGLIGYLRASGKMIIFLAHCKEPKIDMEGHVIIPAGIQIPGKLGGYLAAQADFIGNCFKKQIGAKTEYFVSFQGGALGTWGSRITELEDRILQLPRENQFSAIAAVFETPKAKSDTKAANTETKAAPAKTTGGKAAGGKK